MPCTGTPNLTNLHERLQNIESLGKKAPHGVVSIGIKKKLWAHLSNTELPLNKKVSPLGSLYTLVPRVSQTSRSSECQERRILMKSEL